MVTLEQYNKAVSTNRRRTYYLLAVQLVVFVVCFFAIPLGGAALLRPHGDAYIEAWAQWVVQHGVSPGLILLITLPIGFLLALPAIGVLRLTNRCMRQDRRLICPHCDSPLNSLATVTGNCPRCGERALALPDEASTTALGHQLLSVEEFNAAVHNRRRLADPEHRDPRLKCPACRADLMSGRFLIVTTRKCLNCQAPLLEDPENTLPIGDAHPEQHLLSLIRFREAHRSYSRWSLGGGIALAFLAVAPAFLVACWGTPLEQRLGEVGAVVLAFAVLIVSACLAVWIGHVAGRHIRRQLRVDCPHCGGLLFHPSGVVLATRRCHHCGRRVLTEEANTPSALSTASQP